MNPHTATTRLVASLATMAPGPPETQPRIPKARPLRVDPDALRVDCPTCHAAPGEPCDPRTLGRWGQHWGRVVACREED